VSSTELIAATASLELLGWRARLRAAVYALYRRLDDDPRRRPFLPGASRTLVDRAGAEKLADLIDEGRAEPGAPASLTRVTAEALGGAILLELALAGARERPLPPEEELVPGLMYSAVLPYAGAAAAAEELGLGAPPR